MRNERNDKERMRVRERGRAHGRGRARGRRGRERGFTLMEAMVVVAIIGLIAALASPSLMGMYRGMTVSSSARSLYAAFVEAQGLAKTESRRYCVWVDGSTGSWAVRLDRNNNIMDFCEVEVRRFENPYSHVRFGPKSGYPEAFPAPYENVPHDSWCTFCGGDDAAVGTVMFDVDGSVRWTTGQLNQFTSGSIALYDKTGSSKRREALVIYGLTGDIHIFRAGE